VYQTETTDVAVRWTERRFWSRAWQAIVPNVWYLGLTSLLTDVSSEMVTSVLPAYLVLQLNLSPFAFGTLDGLYNGVSAATRWASGVVADRWRRYKEIAAVGYVMSAVCRVGLLAAGSSWTGLAAAIAADRLGKGIRTIPRDALISLSTPPDRLAQSFGVHRAMDAAGAMLGPVVAFALLRLVPGGFDVVFVTSFCIAVVGVGVLALFVNDVTVSGDRQHSPQPSLRAALGLLGIRDFRIIVVTASVLAVLTMSDAFVYLVLQQHLGFTLAAFPLLSLGTAVSYVVLAIPAGMAADRFGRFRLFLVGHGALLLVYVLLAIPGVNAMGLVLTVLLLGAYYAATDGVIVALASGMVPSALRGSGLALLTTATSVGRLIASMAFGWIWMTWSSDRAILSFGLALAGALAVAAATVGRHEWNTND
jgi:MFS family permease